jgi:hypothetical protein
VKLFVSENLHKGSLLAMRKFKVTGGGYNDGKRSYKRGDVVESDLDLAKMFRNQFEEIRAGSAAGEGDDGSKPSPAPAPVPAKKQKQKQPPETEPEKTDSKATTKKVKKKNDSTKKSARKNATKRFPIAVEEDFKVLREGDEYFVIDLDTKEQIHEAPLVKSAVESTIKAYLDE